MGWTVAVIAAAYVLGALPFSWLVARGRGVNLHREGSGNIGASNVWRTAGGSAGGLALVLDGSKGALAVVLARAASGDEAVPVLAGLAAVIGHVWPAWLGFRGGKGVATAAGAFALLAPQALLLAVAVFAVAVAATRYISVGSSLGAVALVAGASMGWSPAPVVAGAAIVAAIVLGRHRGNFARLLAGTERRVGIRATS